MKLGPMKSMFLKQIPSHVELTTMPERLRCMHCLKEQVLHGDRPADICISWTLRGLVGECIDFIDQHAGCKAPAAVKT